MRRTSTELTTNTQSLGGFSSDSDMGKYSVMQGQNTPERKSWTCCSFF